MFVVLFCLLMIVNMNKDIYNQIVDRLKGDCFAAIKYLTAFMDKESLCAFCDDVISKFYKDGD